ncbi:MAG: TSUP family transporter [bacterium]|nr:TSUP family transporter [bacterium]
MQVEFTSASIVLYMLVGLASGLLSSMLGVGAGIIMVPTLTLIALMPQKEAQGISLAVMVPMALMGALRYQLNPDIHLDWRLIAVIAVTALIGVNIGATLVAKLSNKTLQFGFSILLLVAGVRMLLSSLKG